MRLFEWKSSSFKQHQDQLPGFIEYLSGIWQSRNRFEDKLHELTEEEIQERKIQKQRFFDFTVTGEISARNYVGVVQYGDIRVEVYPKIFSNHPSPDFSKAQQNLFYWLSYCRKIKFPYSLANVSQINSDSFLELLIYIFSNSALQVLSQQPFQAYQGVQQETSYLKGRLLFEQYTQTNLSTGKWQHFYCAFEPFVYDNLFNRIIKFVSRRLSVISNNPANKQRLSEIVFLLDDVCDLRCSAEDCDRVTLNPLYEEHRHILELCKLYLSHQVMDLESDESRNFCFLVPMEYVFEDFIYGFMSRHFYWLNLQSQSSDYLATVNNENVFRIKNDIYIRDQLIVDAKYKARKDLADRKAGVDQSDLYQMVSYAVRRNCRDVLLIYPEMHGSIVEPSEFSVDSLMFPKPLTVHVRSLNICIDRADEADEKLVSRFAALHPIFG